MVALLRGYYMERSKSIDIDYMEDYKKVIEISNNINLEEYH